MGIEVDIIFKIAGVGIVVAFLVTILDQVGKKEYAQRSVHLGIEEKLK